MHSRKRPTCAHHDVCDRDFSNEINLSVHKKREHPIACLFLSRYKNEDVECRVCKKILRKIDKHMQVHMRKKNRTKAKGEEKESEIDTLTQSE